MRPELAIADGALGFWKAAGEVWPTMREQRCWVHKTANVLAKLPKSQQPKAKRALQEIWMAETKADAEAAFDAFIEREAIVEASLLGFRPIIMTTIAAALGPLPLALAAGPGSEFYEPIGVTITGGLLISQLLTIYTTPVIYLCLDRLHRCSRWLLP